MKILFILVCALLTCGCQEGNMVSDEVENTKPSRLTLTEYHRTATYAPDFWIYHDSVSGADIVVFKSGSSTSCAVIPLEK